MQFLHPLGYAGEVVFEPVSHQNRLSVRRFDDVFQSIEFSVMDLNDLTAIIINRAVCHLRQFAGERCGIGGGDFDISERQHQLLLQIGVFLLLLIGKTDSIFAADQFRHFQMVGCFHGDGDVGYLLVNGVLRIRQRLVAVDDLPVALVRLKVVGAVLGDEPSQPLTHVQNAELCPQIHQPVGSGSASQPYDAVDLGSGFQHRLEPLCVVVLERGQFVYHDHVKGERDAAFLNKPLDIFSVDDVNVSGSHKCCAAFSFGADSHGADEVLQVIPLIDFRCPCVPCHSQRCDDQDPMHLETVKQQVVDCREGDARFPKSHIQKYGGDGMRFDVIHGIGLVIMWTVFHQGYLQSVLRHPGHIPGNQVCAVICAAKAEVGGAFRREPLLPQRQNGNQAEERFGRASHHIRETRTSDRCHPAS